MRLTILVTSDDVKAECQRRIEGTYPIWKQVNVGRSGGAEAEAMWSAIDHLRTRSNDLEAKRPIPPDYRDDKHWE